MTITRALLISLGIIVILVLIITGLFFLDQSGTITLPENSFFPSIDDQEITTNNNTEVNTNIDFQDPIDIDISNDSFSNVAQITQNAVVGFTFLPSTDGVVVRYMEKGTGHIYDFDVSTQNHERVSNKTMEDVEKVLWGKDGNEFIIQTPYGDAMETTYYSFDTPSARFFFTQTLSPGDNNESVRQLQRALNEDPATLVAFDGIGSPGEESSFYGEKTKNAVILFQEKFESEILTPRQLDTGTGIFDDTTKDKLNELFAIPETLDKETLLSKKLLSDEISSIISSPDQSRVFYLKNIDDHHVIGVTSNPDGTNQKEVITSLFHEWATHWNAPDTIVFTTKPSGNVSGISFSFNVNTGIISKPIGETVGLTTLASGNNANIIYSESRSDTRSFTTNILDTQTQSTNGSSITTLPEKCTWATDSPQRLYCGVPNQIPVGVYPDDWYKGKILFSDSLWLYDTTAKQQNILASFYTELAQDIDIIQPQVDPDETSFIFINKKDLSLWLVRLK